MLSFIHNYVCIRREGKIICLDDGKGDKIRSLPRSIKLPDELVRKDTHKIYNEDDISGILSMYSMSSYIDNGRLWAYADELYGVIDTGLTNILQCHIMANGMRYTPIYDGNPLCKPVHISHPKGTINLALNSDGHILVNYPSKNRLWDNIGHPKKHPMVWIDNGDHPSYLVDDVGHVYNISDMRLDIKNDGDKWLKLKELDHIIKINTGSIYSVAINTCEVVLVNKRDESTEWKTIHPYDRNNQFIRAISVCSLSSNIFMIDDQYNLYKLDDYITAQWTRIPIDKEVVKIANLGDKPIILTSDGGLYMMIPISIGYSFKRIFDNVDDIVTKYDPIRIDMGMTSELYLMSDMLRQFVFGTSSSNTRKNIVKYIPIRMDKDTDNITEDTVE